MHNLTQTHLLGLQPLFLKAEALDLVEVLAHAEGRDVVHRVTSHGLVTAQMHREVSVGLFAAAINV